MPTIIPLTSDPSSIFEIEFAGRIFTLQTLFNSRGSGGEGPPYWTLNIYEGEENIALGLALVLGVDILRQFAFEIGAMFMFDTTETHTEASADTLGIDQILIYVSPEEIAEVNANV